MNVSRPTCLSCVHCAFWEMEAHTARVQWAHCSLYRRETDGCACDDWSPERVHELFDQASSVGAGA